MAPMLSGPLLNLFHQVVSRHGGASIGLHQPKPVKVFWVSDRRGGVAATLVAAASPTHALVVEHFPEYHVPSPELKCRVDDVSHRGVCEGRICNLLCHPVSAQTNEQTHTHTKENTKINNLMVRITETEHCWKNVVIRVTTSIIVLPAVRTHTPRRNRQRHLADCGIPSCVMCVCVSVSCGYHESMARWQTVRQAWVQRYLAAERLCWCWINSRAALKCSGDC